MTILKSAHHRNGVAGVPFGVTLFRDDDGSEKLGIVFSNGDDGGFTGYCAVFDMALLREGVIEFGKNSWRGDNYEGPLRRALAQRWPWASSSPEDGIAPDTPQVLREAINREAADLLLGVSHA